MRALTLAAIVSCLLLAACGSPVGEPCEAKDDCQSGQCEARFDTVLSQCVVDCVDSSECPSGSVCTGLVCAQPCEMDSECPRGTLCGEAKFHDGRICMSPCESDADCKEHAPVCGAGGLCGLP